MVRSWRKN